MFWASTLAFISFPPSHFALPLKTPTFDVDEHELVKRHGAVVGHHFTGLYASQIYLPKVFFTCQSGQGTTSQSWVFGHWKQISMRKRNIYFTLLKKWVSNNFLSSYVESIQWWKCDLKAHSSPLGSSRSPRLLCWVSAQCKPVSGRLELPGHGEGFLSLLCCGTASLTACALLLMWSTWKKNQKHLWKNSIQLLNKKKVRQINTNRC